MGDNPDQRDFVKRLAEKTGCKIVALLHLDQFIASDESYADITPYDITPADFVSLVKYADYVCTDSFHGTVFSIIYSRNFFTFMRFKKTASLSTNTRIESLLNTLGLMNRLFDGISSVEGPLTIENWVEVQQRVSILREKSLKYLLESIGL